jgi:hypothetical protein
MDEFTRARIRSIVLAPGRSVARSRAAALLGMSAGELEREIASGVIVAGSAPRSRIGREELIAAAMRLWEQAVIEEALGDDAAAVLPAALRLADLPAPCPVVPPGDAPPDCRPARHLRRRRPHPRAGSKSLGLLRGAGRLHPRLRRGVGLAGAPGGRRADSRGPAVDARGVEPLRRNPAVSSHWLPLRSRLEGARAAEYLRHQITCCRPTWSYRFPYRSPNREDFP